MSELTVEAALKSQVPYPIDDAFVSSAMIGRGLNGDEPFTQAVTASVAWKGALSDCLAYLWRYPQSVSEGGVSITKGELSVLKSEVNRLRSEIGEPPVDADDRPQITAY